MITITAAATVTMVTIPEEVITAITIMEAAMTVVAVAAGITIIDRLQRMTF